MSTSTHRPRAPPAGANPDGDHVRVNLDLWQRQSDSYDRRHARTLSGRFARAWGLWRIPERELRLLGPTRGRSVLELGCGAGRWSIALARGGARAVGIDLTPAQLDKARRLSRGGRGRPEWVRGDVERLPFRNDSFDLAFADWGAMTFCDPHRTVPEVARVLRRGGRLVFATSSPLRAVAQDRRTDRMGPRLRYDYFGLGRIDYPGEVNFVLNYADWIRLFAHHGFGVERLVETSAPADRRSSYLSRQEHRWGSHWPLESIWSVVKQGDGRSRPTSRGNRRSVARRRRSVPEGLEP